MTNLEYIKSHGAKELADLICSDDGYVRVCGICKESGRVCNRTCREGIVDWLLSEREKELKPCPFCGGKARAHDTIQWSLVSCDECSAELRGYTKDEAIEAWNRRTE